MENSTHPECDELTPLRQDVAFDTVIWTVKRHGTNQKRKYQNVRQRCRHVNNLRPFRTQLVSVDSRHSLHAALQSIQITRNAFNKVAACIIYVIWHYTTVDIYEAPRAECSVKIFRLRSHNTPV